MINTDSRNFYCLSSTASQEHPYIQALSKRPILEWSPVFSQYLVPSESNVPVDAVFPSPSDASSGLYPIESIAHYQVMDDQILFCSGNAVYLGTLGQVLYRERYHGYEWWCWHANIDTVLDPYFITATATATTDKFITSNPYSSSSYSCYAAGLSVRITAFSEYERSRFIVAKAPSNVYASTKW